MEFPSFNHHHHHHHNRYAPPPPTKNFSDDRPNVYPHQHHHPPQPGHLHPPPPLSYPTLPRPPPQHPLPVLPPPPSYNPHQSHFTFLDAQNPPFLNHSRSSPPPPRFSNHSYRFDYRNDSRSDPPRVQPELPNRNPMSSDDQHLHLYSPNPQSENYCKPHVSERVIHSSRFRDDTINDGYGSRDISNIVSQEQQVHLGGPNNDRVIDRYASARSAMNRNVEGYVEKYEPRYMAMSDSERVWDRHGEEDSRWVMKGKQNEFAHSDGVLLVSGRVQSRDYEYQSSKFNRPREGREEFKQVQKKSVLLRIGKPNNTYSNRSHEQHSSKPYLVKPNNSNCRGIDKDKDKDRDRDQTAKGSSLSLDQKIDEDREHSPVDLDVSFKSNGLIAKAVLTPSSPMSDNNDSQARNRKIKRITEFGSPLSKFSDRSTSGSSHGLDSPSTSEKAPKQATDKDSVSNVDNRPLSGPVLVQDGGSVRSDGPLSFRLRKKRRLIAPSLFRSNAFDFQLGDKDKNSVKGDDSQDSPIESIRGAIASPPLEETISSKLDKSPLAVDSEKNDLEVDNPGLSYMNNFGDGSTKNKNLINDGLVNDLNQQPCENENSPSLESDIQKISTDVKLSLGGTDISSTSGQDQTEILKCPTESNVRSNAANASYDLCNGSVNTQEIRTTADINSLDSSSDEIIIVSPENRDVKVFLDDASRKEDESQLIEGTSKQTCFIGSSEFPEDGPKESIHTAIDVEDNASPNSSHKEVSSDNDEVTEMVNYISTSVQPSSPDQREPSTDVKDDLLPSSSIISAFANGTGSYVTDSYGKSAESVPDMVTGVVSSQNVSSLSGSQMLTCNSTCETISDSSILKNDVNLYEKSVSDGALLNGLKSFAENSKTRIKTNHSALQCSSVNSLDSNTKLQGPNLPMKKPSSVSAGPKIFAGHPTRVFTNGRINNLTKKLVKPRTWHRSISNPVPLPPKQIVTGQNSYIRSGNSLVRKNSPAPVTAIASGSAPPASRSSSVYQLNASGPIETRNIAASGIKSNNTNSRTAGFSAPVVRPKTPPLPGSNKLPDCPTYSRDLQSSPLEHLPASHVEGNFAVQKVSEDQTSNSESQKLQYVRRKSNQLVAASSSDQSIHDLDKAQASLSDSYYKRRKNQLIRTSVGDDSAANTDVPKTSKSNTKRQSGKGLFKKYKLLRFPSVWTLNNSMSLGKDGISLRQKKLRPQLFPWKRSISSNSLSSSISRKLQISRKREMIYTRSRYGLSLHMSKLLSVGGSSLKWSKSLERNSKRVNKEATLAVAAAEKKKREQHGSVDRETRNNISRDRIFRIGLVRYKMDPSRRTLQKISDEEEPSTSTQSKEAMRKSYVPKRLKIGHDEYVRIGNGNQLVRNPKRRTRIFANEKVRWSLHTARSRLAKKKKYCQFFTRFGKCNKDDGKCPYIHDSSKIAVCTKFLNGSCSNHNCKLTHEVIPERMQDCSYFLQGFCSNKQCPYRHVNVNAAASICEGFLKGYCADGNECRKKHTYACPVFEATGTCSQGTKCKLHHPKNRLKRKQDSMEQQQKNARGRYFGSMRDDGGEAIPIAEKHHHYSKDDDDVDDDRNRDVLCQEGRFAEYISLDFGNDEAGELTSDQRTTLSSEPLGLDAADFDELTKPIGIMNKVVLDSPNDCDLGIS